MRRFSVFEWEQYPGKGMVADVFVEDTEEPIENDEVILLDEKVCWVKETIQYCGRGNDSMVGVVTQEI